MLGASESDRTDPGANRRSARQRQWIAMSVLTGTSMAISSGGIGCTGGTLRTPDVVVKGCAGVQHLFRLLPLKRARMEYVTFFTNSFFA